MPRSCCFVGFTNNCKKNNEFKFYRIPKNEAVRRKWLNAINRAADSTSSKQWSPTSSNVYVCSAHFIIGKRELFEKHPSSVPSIFDTGMKGSPQRNTNNHKINRVKISVPACKKLKLCAQSISEDVDFVIEKRSFSNKEIDIQVSTEDYLQQSDISNPICSKNFLEQSSSHEFSVPIITEDVYVQDSSKSYIQERQQLYSEINNLRLERDLFMSKWISLKDSNCSLGINKIRANPDKCNMLTGLNLPVLEKLLSFLCKGTPEIKLRRHINFDMLSFMFDIKKTTALDNFWKWIDIMYVKLKYLIKMQDLDYIYETFPPVFKHKFPRLTSIIDCFEVFVESPSSLMARALFYSQYKKHCTIKCLISCTPNGTINFISKCYGGRASDNQITRESEFASSKYHMPGDQILLDRGFTLQDDFAAGSCSILINPAFTKDKAQLSASEVEKSRKISSVRIHIERVIGLLKNRYTIVQGVLPLQTVKNITDEATSVTLSNCDKM
nr:uncharacterized protein LOC101238119 [Hydra vulgaris]